MQLLVGFYALCYRTSMNSSLKKSRNLFTLTCRHQEIRNEAARITSGGFLLEVFMISAWWLIPVFFIGAFVGGLLMALLAAGRNGK